MNENMDLIKMVLLCGHDFSYSELQWEAFKNWGIFKDYIYLTTIAEQRILVRKDELSEEDREELFDLLNANVKR